MKQKLEWTGERMVDSPQLAKGIVEHLHRYALAIEFIENKVVLDIACGEGYGSNLMAQKANKVIGVDISASAIEHAKKRYVKKNLSYKLGSVLQIPLGDGEIDVVVSFETLEHLVEQNEMLKEFKRVLKHDGLLLISTPEKENYKHIDPNNPYHLKELSYNDFGILINNHFSKTKIVQQRFIFSSQIYDSKQSIENWLEYSGCFEKIQQSKFIGGHFFNIAICSNGSKELLFNSSVFNGNKQFEDYESFFYGSRNTNLDNEKINLLKSSINYKVGKFVLSPLRFLKNIFK